jgi:mono/diheme cytochrome c family protein
MRCLIILLFLFAATSATAATLAVENGRRVSSLTTAQLLARADARDITVPGDVSYHATRTYRAVPLKAVLADLAPAAHVQFVALDGFAAEIPAVLFTGKSEAWLAIEPPDHPWPRLAADKPGAGPFYLVWLHPEASGVGSEQWPYQIARIRVLGDPASRFPAMRPAAGLAPDEPVMKGFAVFQRNCISCHTLNGQGDAKLGPDLNIPHSPTEYLRDDMFRLLVRNPQDMRHWPQAKMPGFNRDALSDADLDALVAYLKHMATQRQAKQPHPG